MPLSEVYSEPFPDLGDPRIKACLRLPEAYRSLATSFFGSWCQGIPTCTRGSLTLSSLENCYSDSFSLTPHCQRPSWRALIQCGSRLGHAMPSTARVPDGRSSRTGPGEELCDEHALGSGQPGVSRSAKNQESQQEGSGDDRTRTDDLLVANQMLYQLSYVPTTTWSSARWRLRLRPEWTRTTDLTLNRRTL